MEGTSIPRLFPIIGIANALNEEDIPTFLGKQWYNATLFRVLKNPAYIGRTYYRRTEATYVRDPNRDRRRRHVTERARDEWVEIEGATEAIISEELFERVQERLRDPERLRMGHRTHTYGLAGHIRCALCGASMVGQTLRPNYRYYRCRRSFAGPKHDRCSARYLRADLIEGAVRGGVAKVLSAPEIIKIELERLSLVADSSPTVDDALALVEAERQGLFARHKSGEVEDDAFEQELMRLRRDRERALSQKPGNQKGVASSLEGIDLEAVCAGVDNWLQEAAGEDIALIAAALDITVVAGPKMASLEGKCLFSLTTGRT